MSGRIRSKAAADALKPALDHIAEDLSKNAATLNAQGQLKMPKRKKVLTEDEQIAKDLTSLFKKPLAHTS